MCGQSAFHSADSRLNPIIVNEKNPTSENGQAAFYTADALKNMANNHQISSGLTVPPSDCEMGHSKSFVKSKKQRTNN